MKSIPAKDENCDKSRVKDTHEPFKDSNEKIEDAIVSLKENYGRGRASLSKTYFSL